MTPMRTLLIMMASMRFLVLSIGLLCLLSCMNPKQESRTENPPLSKILKDYVDKPDDSFRYELRDSITGDGWVQYNVWMVSGNWLTEKEVEETEWWHWLTVVKPDERVESEALMFIGGGSSNDSIPDANEALIGAALKTKSIMASISNIPFQPIDFVGDEKEGRYEDDLIAYGWRRFLENGAKDSDAKWLARLPMTRAVVRAMDVVQAMNENSPLAVDSFVVAGASKRGWTTWTTGVVDDRVMAIAPVVIDLLNVVPSFNHHWRCYGEWSPAINDYINEGIMSWMGSKEYDRLLQLVEPYSHIEELDLPKFMINASGDEFFVTDSWQFYWDDLEGEKYIQYIPNTNHGLNGSYNLGSLLAFYNAIITESDIPSFYWDVTGNKISVRMDPNVDYDIRYWEAENDSQRDFRLAVIGDSWKLNDTNEAGEGEYSFEVKIPESGYKAGVVEIIINPDSELPFTFTTGTVVVPGTYPFEEFVPEAPMGTR